MEEESAEVHARFEEVEEMEVQPLAVQLHDHEDRGQAVETFCAATQWDWKPHMKTKGKC